MLKGPRAGNLLQLLKQRKGATYCAGEGALEAMGRGSDGLGILCQAKREKSGGRSAKR